MQAASYWQQLAAISPTKGTALFTAAFYLPET